MLNTIMAQDLDSMSTNNLSHPVATKRSLIKVLAHHSRLQTDVKLT